MAGLVNFLTNWKTIILLLVVTAFYGLYLIPSQVRRIERIKKSKVTLLDFRLAYSNSDVQSLFQKLKPKGRSVYKSMLQRFDSVFPVLYAGLIGLLMLSCMERLSNSYWGLYLLLFLPAFVIVFDYLENFNTVAMINAFPKISEVQVAWGERMTQLKYGSIMLTVGSLVTLLTLKLGDNKKTFTPLNIKTEKSKKRRKKKISNG